MTEPMQQYSLVAFWGEKKESHPLFHKKIKALILELAKILGEKKFKPYEDSKIHSTLIGLERILDQNDFFNKNYLEQRGERKKMDIRGFLHKLIEAPSVFPINIRVGGYEKNQEYPFSSRNLHPFFRSFSIQGNAPGSRLVLMGWPCEKGAYPPTIDELRKKANPFNILHKYHKKPGDYDNDAYFVLGTLKKEIPPDLFKSCEKRLQKSLAEGEHLDVKMKVNDLKIIAYQNGDTTFERGFEVFSIEEFLKGPLTSF